jgi:hypothetical protein
MRLIFTGIFFIYTFPIILTLTPNVNHEVQEIYAEIHYPPQNGTETQPKVTKVDQEQELPLLVVAFYVVADCWNSAYLWFVIVHNLGAEKFDVGRLGRLTL